MGGVLVGTTRQGMSFTESLDVYGRLTIGDGLLAQIPALLVSLAAALLVARVEDRSAAKSRAILPRDPLVFAAPAATLTVLALWDDMPTLVFSSVALVLFGVLFWVLFWVLFLSPFLGTSRLPYTNCCPDRLSLCPFLGPDLSPHSMKFGIKIGARNPALKKCMFGTAWFV